MSRILVQSSKIILASIGGIGLYSYASDSRAGIHSAVIMPLIHLLDPETAHNLSITLLKYGISPKDRKSDDAVLATRIWGKTISNPIGLAAGYDKNANGIDALLDLGFGLVEIGSVTPEPQSGNPLPRFFRLEKDQAVINRYGFNSDGHQEVETRLANRVRNWLCWNPTEVNKSRSSLIIGEDSQERWALRANKLLGVNTGKNKTSSPESHEDYIKGVKKLGAYADYIVVNISSPNTPGLRALQRREPIEELLTLAKSARDSLAHMPPLLVKIAPDCTDAELEDIASVVKSVGIDGVIISNTTVSRPASLLSDKNVVNQMGGLSGPPVLPLAIETVSKFYKLTAGTVPIIGCGGISNAQDCLRFAKAGASLVQLYTSLGYRGPGLVREIKDELVEVLRKEGRTWGDYVGLDHK